MSILLNDEALCCGARRLAVQLAAALPAPEDGFSPAFQADMTALTRCVTRRQAVRRWGRRAAAAALTALLTFGAVLAASPTARAAVSRWFLRVTSVTTLYDITPSAEEPTPGDYTPAAPAGYTLTGDFTGGYNDEKRNGVRVMRWTSAQGDLLFEAVPLTGSAQIRAELRDGNTGGIYNTETGQRPMGEEGMPEGYDAAPVTVHGISAQLYRFAPAGQSASPARRGYGLWFYRGEDTAPFHYVAVPAGASALVWVDEQANCFFLLTGGETQSELLSMAESVYRSERSE